MQGEPSNKHTNVCEIKCFAESVLDRAVTWELCVNKTDEPREVAKDNPGAVGSLNKLLQMVRCVAVT